MGNKVECYTYRIEWSEENGEFVASRIEFPGLGPMAVPRKRPCARSSSTIFIGKEIDFFFL